jgi:transposase
MVAMEVLLERCAGLDVHQASVVCCVLIGAPGRKPQKLLRSFGTTTRELEALRAWLVELGVTHVGMESTGIYWKPVYAVLEDRFDLTVGNAHHIKHVPGRKTDVKDAEWIAQLVRHGLVAKSFVPPPAIRDLRELMRHRRTLVETRTAMRNRVLKLLESASIKLAGVASDVFGVSGRAMLEALAAGTASVAEMAGLARGRMRRKHGALEAALEGRLREPQRFLLAMHLRGLEAIERDLEALDARIECHLEPFRAQHRLLMQIPGVEWVTAAAIIAEIGIDTWARSPPPDAWRPGPGSRRATSRARASRRGPRRARATCSSSPPCSRPPPPRSGPRAAITVASTTAFAPAAARYAPSWLSLTSCSSPRSTC